MPAKKEIKAVFTAISALFALFLVVPVVMLLSKSFSTPGGLGLDNYRNILTSAGFLEALRGSVAISAASAAAAAAVRTSAPARTAQLPAARPLRTSR